VESGSKLISPTAGGASLGIDKMFAEVSADKFAIAWGGLRQSRDFPNLRVLPIAAQEGGPYITPSLATLRDRSYPLTRSIYMFVRGDSAGKLDDRVREFLLYVLSRQGQEDVSNTNVYLPLPSSLVAQQRRLLK
jgi:phosphate transport system substrate-binding protein